MRRALVVAAVAGLCLVGASTAQAVFPGQNGRIAYPDSNGSIHTVLPSGHGDRVIGQGSDAAWSPNGRRIAFSRGTGNAGNIYTMRADGSDVRQLTFFEHRYGYSPSYAPTGRRIVFLWSGTIVVMRRDGLKRRALGPGGDPIWSPAGKIAYQRSSPAGKIADQRNMRYGGSIWTMRPNGTDRRRLVSLGSGPTFAGGDGPFYSPNGHKFIFTRCQWDGATAERCDGFLARANGSHVRPAPCGIGDYWGSTSGGGGLRPLTYAPDGKEFLVTGVPDPSGTSNVVRVALPSCAWHRVVGRVFASADWQALPAP
jgi:WD40-like Beta Propeller Repeat